MCCADRSGADLWDKATWRWDDSSGGSATFAADLWHRVYTSTAFISNSTSSHVPSSQLSPSIIPFQPPSNAYSCSSPCRLCKKLLWLQWIYGFILMAVWRGLLESLEPLVLVLVADTAFWTRFHHESSTHTLERTSAQLMEHCRDL